VSSAPSYSYRPLYKPNQLACGSGQTAVVTGWTIKQAITKHLDSSEFAAIGQLYNPTRGINFLIRNLLANPHVRFLVILNATKEDRNAGAVKCLLDFLQNGFALGYSDTGRQCWQINSQIAGYIDLEIDSQALENLRRSLKWQEAHSISEAIDWVKYFAAKGNIEPWDTPQQFPLPETETIVFPGERYGHRIEGKTIAETWVKIIHLIKTTGVIRQTQHDSQWQELIDLMAIVTAEPPDFYFPEPNYLPCDRQFLENYIEQILADAPVREGVKYTYGQRLRSWFGKDQIEQVIDKLVADPNSARAVMSLWDVQDGNYEQSPPCLNHIWARIVDGEISLTATFRSNDMFAAWPANAMGLRALQQHLQVEIGQRSGLNLTIGPLITVSQSAHIYDDCWDSADRVIRQWYGKICRQRDYRDPVGNFTNELEDDKILVERVSPQTGEAIARYRHKSARSLYQQIAADCPALQVEHALYLGTQLQQAEIALLLGFPYEQDKPLTRLQLMR